MTKKNLIKTLAAVLTLSLFTGVMAGCGSRSADGNMNPGTGDAPGSGAGGRRCDLRQSKSGNRCNL